MTPKNEVIISLRKEIINGEILLRGTATNPPTYLALLRRKPRLRAVTHVC
jgi:hypothetical protein